MRGGLTFLFQWPEIKQFEIQLGPTCIQRSQIFGPNLASKEISTCSHTFGKPFSATYVENVPCIADCCFVSYTLHISSQM